MPSRSNGSHRLVRTVLFTDIVESTPLVAEIGDKKWQKLVERHDAMVRAEISRYKGEEIERTGDGFFATFDVPEQGIRCAWAVVRKASRLGIEIRAGLHTGECELRDGHPRGLAVHIAARVASRAGPGEVLVSSTVKDLATGSGIRFKEQGSHVLKGVPGKWNLFSVLQITAAKPGSKQPPRAKPRDRGNGELSVMIVDDHPLWRETLRKVVEAVGRVVAEASNGEEALKLAVSKQPEVVLMDMHLSKMNGIEATRRIRRDCPEVRVLVLSSDEEKKTVLQAVRAGASGYMVKTATADEITDAITRIRRGELAFPPALAEFVLAELRGEDQEETLRVAVVADSVIDREGLASVLTQGGFDVISRLADVNDLSSTEPEQAAQVVVIDVGSGPNKEGTEAVAKIRESQPDLGVVVLADQVDSSHAETILSKSGRGAGYLLRYRVSRLEELGDAIRRVALGDSVIDPEVVAGLVAKPQGKTPLAQLSEREREVLALMAEGRSNQAISDGLFLSLKSVEGYVSNIFSKLGLEPTTDDHRRVLAVITYLRSP